MKVPSGCKLFGAQQALAGIRDGVILFHSVVGCNFGTMTYHVPSDQRDIRQTCTIINDSDIIFSGENSLRKAIANTLELFHPKVLFVVSGCVSEMIGDHIGAVVSEFGTETPIVYIEAAGFRGDAFAGYEAACQKLLPLMKTNLPMQERTVNILGCGADDYRLAADVKAIQELLNGEIRVQTVLSCCDWEQVCHASQASLNLVVEERALKLAQAMEKKFSIPYEQISYPYGITGMWELFGALSRHFHVDFQERACQLERQAVQSVERVYSYLQSLYGVPAAVIGSGGRAAGMKRFLEKELGMEIVCFAKREKRKDLEDFYDEVRNSEAALIFGSSFEQALAEEKGISLIRYDYPVFDELSLTDASYAGPKGIPAIIESILNTVMKNPALKGAFYQ